MLEGSKVLELSVLIVSTHQSMGNWAAAAMIEPQGIIENPAELQPEERACQTKMHGHIANLSADDGPEFDSLP